VLIAGIAHSESHAGFYRPTGAHCCLHPHCCEKSAKNLIHPDECSSVSMNTFSFQQHTFVLRLSGALRFFSLRPSDELSPMHVARTNEEIIIRSLLLCSLGVATAALHASTVYVSTGGQNCGASGLCSSVVGTTYDFDGVFPALLSGTNVTM
jgi:hypothetical protein